VGRVRVSVVNNIVAPYRHALFEELSALVDLQVLYCAETHALRDWDTGRPQSYPAEVCRHVTVYPFGHPVIVTRDLTSRLRRFSPDVTIVALTPQIALPTVSLMLARIMLGDWALVFWVGNVDWASDDVGAGGLTRLTEWYCRSLAGLADGAMYYSSRTVQWATQRGVLVEPYMVGTQVLPSSGMEARLEPREGTWNVGFVGRPGRRKGFDLLVETIAGLPDQSRRRILLKVYGSGTFKSEYGILNELGVMVRHYGEVPREQLLRAYTSLDLLVLPSRSDPWGFVTNEAMACGTPVLCSKYAGSAALARHAGWIFDPVDEESRVQSLAEALEQCRDRGIRKRAVKAESCYRPASAAARIAKMLCRVVGCGEVLGA